jgi:SAM-dependent methyltransferase/acyl carrier protein
MARRIVNEPDCRWLPTLRAGRADWEQLLETLGELYTTGVQVDWAAFDRGYSRRKISLPTYPFERSRYWPEIAPRASRIAGPDAAESFRDWLYELEWQPLADDTAADYIPSPARLQQAAGSEAQEFYRQLPPADDEAAYREIDGLCSDYIIEAFAALDQPLRPGDRFSTETLRRRLGVLDRYGRLFERLLNILAEDGVLTSQGDEWVVAQTPPHEPAQLLHQTLAARHPLYGPELSVLNATAPRLADVLAGRADPMQLLFPGGSLDLASRLYYDARPVPLFNALIERCIAEAIRGLPEGRTLRILEIGAGTGGATAVVLPKLPPDRSSYTFTDVSPQFLDQARGRFADYPFIDYRLLNLDEPVGRQGLTGEAFDIVIAANVVHATRNLRQSLDQIKHLLKPEGLVLLLEVIRPQRFGDLTFGLTDGWWAFVDTDLRANSAFISEARWLELFRETGFAEAAAVPGDAVEKSGLFANQSVLLARKPAAARAQIAPGRWLIWADEQGVGRQMADRLRARGNRCLVVTPGNHFESPRPDEYRIRPVEPDDIRRVIETFRGSNPSDCRAGVYLWGLDALTTNESGLPAARAAVEHACRGALTAVQSILQAGGLGGGSLAFVTRGGPQPAQSALWALAGVVATEHPELRCRRIDLDATTGAEILLKELLLKNNAVPDQLALRGNGRAALKLKRSAAHGLCYPPCRMKADAAYMITGGLTGLGLETAGWLVRRGAKHLALVGRRPPGQEAQAAIDSWTGAGIEVACFQADIADPDAADRIFATLHAMPVPLRGVVHCAGTLDDAAVPQMTWDRFERVLKAKVDGGWNLHRHTRSAELDFFVLYSSGASLLCPPGLANHAAANAFLNGLAHYRQSCHLPGLSINWGPWREAGTATNREILDRIEGSGMETLDTVNGFKALECLLASGVAQAAVLPIDWTKFPAGAALFANLKADHAEADSRTEQRVLEPGAWLGKLEAAIPSRRRVILQELIAGEAGQVLGIKPSQPIDPRQPLQELGLDSLMAVQFRTTLATLAGVELSPALLFNYPSVDQLVDHLSACMATEEGASGAASQSAGSKLDIDALSEDELVRLLEEQIHLT